MRAFILRRVALIALGGGGLVLLGSRHSASTMHLKEFLTRNGQPFTYEDLESDPAVQAMLDRFHVGVKEVPVVICEGGHVLRNPTIESLAESLGLSLDLDADGDARRGHRRRGSGGARGGRLCSVRGARRAGARRHGARRPGGDELANRKLPRLSHGHLGNGARGTRHEPGRKIRRRGGHRPPRRAARLRLAPLQGEAVERRSGADENRRHRHGRAVPKARPPRAHALRGGRRLLQRDAPRGAAMRKRRSRGGRRRQFGGAGRGLSLVRSPTR